MINRLKRWLGDRRAMVALVGPEAAAAIVAAAKLEAAKLGDAAQRMDIISQIVSRVDIAQNEIMIIIDSTRLAHLLGIAQAQAVMPLTCPATRVRQGKDVRLIAPRRKEVCEFAAEINPQNCATMLRRSVWRPQY